MPYVNSHGTDLYYELHGEGETALVFAHGMGGNAAIWYQQVAAFSGDYRVITFDHRYFARSGCPEAQFKPAWFPDDIQAIMDATDTDRAVFICQSMGGWTGSQMAIHHPDRVLGLLMSHTPGVFEHESAVLDMAEVNRKVSEQSDGETDSFANAALAHDYPEKNMAGAVLYDQISAFNGIDRAVIPRGIGAAGLGTNTDTLSDYRVPTLFVTADKDILFPAVFIEALSKTVPGAGFVNLGDAGHSSYFEVPEAFNAELRKFLGRI